MFSRRDVWQTVFLSDQWRLSGASPKSIEDDRIQSWNTYLADVLPCNLGVRRPEWYPATPTALRPITDITESFGDFDKAGRPADFEVSFLGARVLIVNAGAPDTDLKNHFDAWLAEQRTQSPLPARRRGRPATNFAITPDHFRSWARYHVLAVLDLDFYAQVFGIKPLSHEQLGHLLERRFKFEAKDWGRNARAKAAEAMRCLDVLQAQIEAKTGA